MVNPPLMWRATIQEAVSPFERNHRTNFKEKRQLRKNSTAAPTMSAYVAGKVSLASVSQQWMSTFEDFCSFCFSATAASFGFNRQVQGFSWMEGTKSRFKHLHPASQHWPKEKSHRHRNMKTSIRATIQGETHKKTYKETTAWKTSPCMALENYQGWESSWRGCEGWRKQWPLLSSEHLGLKEWFRQIPGKTSELSVQKRAVQGTAKMLRRNLQAELKRGPDRWGRASGRFIAFQKPQMQS